VATIYDVAKRAGVAPITVSRVINNSGYISQETRERVLEAANELGYVHNRLASSLRSRRTNLLALVLTDITNPFFTQLARGVEDTASDAGYTVIFCNTDESEAEEKKYIDILLQNQVDGILLVPGSQDTPTVETIQRNGTPVVVLDRRVDTQVDTVRGDSEGGAYRLTELLLSLGHRRIALLNGPRHVSVFNDREAGCRSAFSAAGLSPSEDLFFSGPLTQEGGFGMAQQALQATPRPTALFAANNFIAIGAVHALQAAGLRVPQDMAVVAFDDLPAAMVISPFLTVAVQPAYEMGRLGTQILLERLAGKRTSDCQETVLPSQLIVRESSGAPI